ncbi:hypothetical protein D3C76_1409120 [compost metagenome]
MSCPVNPCSLNIFITDVHHKLTEQKGKINREHAHQDNGRMGIVQSEPADNQKPRNQRCLVRNNHKGQQRQKNQISALEMQLRQPVSRH